MVPLTPLLETLRVTFEEWRRLRWVDLYFTESRPAMLVFVVLLAVAAFLLIARRLGPKAPRRRYIALPAVLPVVRRSRVESRA